MESEQKYRTLVETTGTGFVIVDAKGNVLDANPEYVRLTGHTRLAEIAGRNVLEWTAEYEKEKNAQAVQQCVRNGFIRNFEIDYVSTYRHDHADRDQRDRPGIRGRLPHPHALPGHHRAQKSGGGGSTPCLPQRYQPGIRDRPYP